jgi:hypothetical protein
MVTPSSALGDFKQCRLVLNRALHIQDQSELHRSSARTLDSGSSSSIAELLVLCARAASACGDADDALSMIGRSGPMAARLSINSRFWYHVTSGEAQILVAESSQPAAAKSAAAAAAASFSQALATLPSSSAVAKMRLHVAIGEWTCSVLYA